MNSAAAKFRSHLLTEAGGREPNRINTTVHTHRRTRGRARTHTHTHTHAHTRPHTHRLKQKEHEPIKKLFKER